MMIVAGVPSRKTICLVELLLELEKLSELGISSSEGLVTAL